MLADSLFAQLRPMRKTERWFWVRISQENTTTLTSIESDNIEDRHLILSPSTRRLQYNSTDWNRFLYCFIIQLQMLVAFFLLFSACYYYTWFRLTLLYGDAVSLFGRPFRSHFLLVALFTLATVGINCFAIVHWRHSAQTHSRAAATRTQTHCHRARCATLLFLSFIRLAFFETRS